MLPVGPRRCFRLLLFWAVTGGEDFLRRRAASTLGRVAICWASRRLRKEAACCRCWCCCCCCSRAPRAARRPMGPKGPMALMAPRAPRPPRASACCR
uniref:Putative secreted protein n=1 Tax=Ixodes ricinus TaxID=34613 RepID=A0A6B0UAD0_IXORI